MKSLLRTKVDKFTVEEAITLSELQKRLDESSEKEWIFIEPVDGVFRKYTSVTAKAEVQKLVVNGNRIPVELISDFSEEKMQENVRLYDSLQKFIGIYTYIEESKEYKPVKLFMD